jgi:hypothetical protein
VWFVRWVSRYTPFRKHYVDAARMGIAVEDMPSAMTVAVVELVLELMNGWHHASRVGAPIDPGVEGSSFGPLVDTVYSVLIFKHCSSCMRMDSLRKACAYRYFSGTKNYGNPPRLSSYVPVGVLNMASIVRPDNISVASTLPAIDELLLTPEGSQGKSVLGSSSSGSAPSEASRRLSFSSADNSTVSQASNATEASLDATPQVDQRRLDLFGKLLLPTENDFISSNFDCSAFTNIALKLSQTAGDVIISLTEGGLLVASPLCAPHSGAQSKFVVLNQGAGSCNTVHAH